MVDTGRVISHRLCLVARLLHTLYSGESDFVRGQFEHNIKRLLISEVVCLNFHS